jgi:hypothetical protein
MTSWQFLKKHWVMSLIGLVILLVAAGSIIYAVATGEGDEGFMKGKDGKPLTWARSDIPVTCMYDESVQEHQYEMDLARDEIKKRVGDIIGICDIWQVKEPFPKKPVKGAILLKLAKPDEVYGDGVYVSSPWDPQHGGTTELYTDKETGKLYGAIIYVNPEIPKELRQRVWLHEFLHAFGLDHDRLQSSIMYPTAAGRPKTLSDRDVKRLQEVYVK